MKKKERIVEVFRIEQNGSFTASRTCCERDSYVWDYINFNGFNFGNIKINGCALKGIGQNEWYIDTPFRIIKDDGGNSESPLIIDLDLIFNLEPSIIVDSESWITLILDKLCEIATTDLFAFEKELHKITGVEGSIRKNNFRVGSYYIYMNNSIGIKVDDFTVINENGITTYDRRLYFGNIPINNWKMKLHLVWNNEEQEWKGEFVQLYRKIETLQGETAEEYTIRDHYAIEEFIQPVKNEVVSFFNTVKSLDFDAINTMLENVTAKLSAVRNQLSYTASLFA